MPNPREYAMPTADLLRIISQVKPFASSDDALPMLNVVRLESLGTHLIAVATDRYALGAAVTPFEGPKFAVSIPLESVDVLQRVLRRRELVATIRVTPKGTLVHVRVGGLILSIPTARGEFPSWRQLIPASNASPNLRVPMFSTDAERLARFRDAQKLAGKRVFTQLWQERPNGPIAMRIGEEFIGILMPVRTSGDLAWEKPAWLAEPKKRRTK